MVAFRVRPLKSAPNTPTFRIDGPRSDGDASPEAEEEVVPGEPARSSKQDQGGVPGGRRWARGRAILRPPGLPPSHEEDGLSRPEWFGLSGVTIPMPEKRSAPEPVGLERARPVPGFLPKPRRRRRRPGQEAERPTASPASAEGGPEEALSTELDRSRVSYDAPGVMRRILRGLLEAASPWREDRAGSLLGDRIVRFTDPLAGERLPFPGYEREPAPLGSGPGGVRTRVRFSTPRGLRGRRYRAAFVPIEAGTSLYGTGENPGRLLRNGRVVESWNWDRFGYTESALSLYQSHPFVLGVRQDGSAFGLLGETTYRCEIDLRAGVTFRALGPSFSVVVIERDHPMEVVEALASLIGRMPLPPRWALGYQQCRWSYHPEARVREVAAEFRARRIPCDVLWMDIDYMEGFKVFTFDPEGFPDPRALNAHLHAQGFRTVYMIDPGIKVEPGYLIYEEAMAGDHVVKREDGQPFVGPVWPGDCVFPDFTRARTRAWWAQLFRDFVALGIDGVWNDMNEPAVFHKPNPAQTMPDETRHDADPELGGPGDHARYHNLYGMLMARATREGIAAARPDRRPFVLTRANFIGGQRYAAAWTGDNTSDWPHLSWSIPMVLSFGLCGQPFAGPDIGGFVGDADGPLFSRWMGIGALLPFSRGHTVTGSRDHEPWAFGPEVEATCRVALERRMRLLPYLYGLFFEASSTGRPVARPLFFLDPSDPGLRTIDDAFLLGGDLLVRASVERHAPPSSPLPSGGWRRIEVVDTEAAVHEDLPELYLRPGAILPLGPVLQHADEAPLDPLTLLVHLGPDGLAEGSLYEDEGEGLGYLEGRRRLTRYEAERKGSEVVIRTHPIEEGLPPKDRTVRVEVLLENDEARVAVGREGGALTVRW